MAAPDDAARKILLPQILLVAAVCATAAATRPGLKLRLSQPGLDYAASVAVDVLSARVRQLSIPDQHGNADGRAGEAGYDVTNIKVNSLYRKT